MSRTSLIKLIHVARRNLQLDDDTYRAALREVTGKTSCRELSVGKLEEVLKSLEDKGFKRTRPRSAARRHRETDMGKKVRHIWHQMFKDGFISDGSDAALDAFVARMTIKTNDGQGIASLAWCKAEHLLQVLESLKQWHMREMKAVLVRGPDLPARHGYDAINTAFHQAVREGHHEG